MSFENVKNDKNVLLDYIQIEMMNKEIGLFFSYLFLFGFQF